MKYKAGDIVCAIEPEGNVINVGAIGIVTHAHDQQFNLGWIIADWEPELSRTCRYGENDWATENEKIVKIGEL